MFRALLYLRLTSLRNLIVFRVTRLRQPKYLIGAVVAVLYVYFFFGRRQGLAQTGSMTAVHDAGNLAVAFLCVGASALFLVRIAFAWIFPAENAGLRFTEAEIAFLFPAPVTRKALIHFRLLSAQVAILFTSILIVFFFRRFGNTGGSRLLHSLGWWIILSTFDLHLTGTNLTLATLKERGRGYLLWRMAAVAVIALYAGAVLLSAAAYLNAHAPVGGGIADFGFVQAMTDSSPLRWLILPFGLVFAPYFATDALGFAIAFVPALAVLALHYSWVLSTEARFEEGSIALAEKRAAIRAAALRGEAPRLGASKPKAHPGPFPLSPKGPAEVAFLWKNLLSMRSSLLNRRAIVSSVWILFCLSFALRPMLAQQARSNGADFYGPIIALFCAVLGGYTLLLGPQIARQDLRNDLPNMDLLKTYPLEGWRLALGELLAPTAILTAILWVCITVSAFAVDPRGGVGWLTPSVRVVTAVSVAMAAPALCLLQLVVPNMLLMVMPSWYQASRSRGGGIELMGQRMILGVGQLLIAAFVAAPAAGAAALIIFSLQHLVGPPAAILLAAAVVLTILCGEAAVGVWWLGERFGRFDLSAETK